MSLTGFINVLPYSGGIFTDSKENDMVIYTQSNSQNIIIGVNSNSVGNIIVSSNLTTINGGVSFVNPLTLNGLTLTSGGSIQNSAPAGQTINSYAVHLSLYGTPSFYTSSQEFVTLSSYTGNYMYVQLPTSSITIQNWTPSYKNTCCLNIPYTGLYSLKFTFFCNPSTSITVEQFISKNCFDGLTDLYAIDKTLGADMSTSSLVNTNYYNEKTLSCTAYLLNTDFINYGFYVNSGYMALPARFTFTATLIQRTA